MVLTKHTKATKYSYAERVLGALTQYQKEHRRHAIHLATLRAQIKKNAQNRKDKLGPNWTNWVNRAVHKLEDEGVLAAHSSNISMTPDGKKALANARKNVLRQKTDHSTAEQEDEIVKEVTHWAATGRVPQGTNKRGRTEESEEGDEGQLGEHQLTFECSGRARSRSRSRSATVQTSWKTPRSVIRTPMKKARLSTKRATATAIETSTPRVKRPISRMTKAELKEEIEHLKKQQQANQHEYLRGTSPLTDIDHDEELERLRETLKEREDELEAMRHELSTSSRRHTTEDPFLDHEYCDRDHIRFATPQSPFELLPSSPTHPLLANRVPERTAFPIPTNFTTTAGSNTGNAADISNAAYSGEAGLERTQSGSIIPRVSRRPTPAPTEPDEDFLETPELGPAGSASQENAEEDRETLPLRKLSLVTPQSTPAGHHRGPSAATGRPIIGLRKRHYQIHQIHQKDVDIGNQERGERGGDEDVEADGAGAYAVLNQLSEARRQLNSRDHDLRDLHVRISELSIKQRETNDRLSQRNVRIEQLEEQALADRLAVDSMKAEVANLLEKNTGEVEEELRRQITELEENVQVFEETLEAEQSEISVLTATLEAARAELQPQSNIISQNSNEREILGTRLEQLKQRVQDADKGEHDYPARLRELESSLEVICGARDDLATEVDKINKDRERLNAQLLSGAAEKRRLEEKLASAEDGRMKLEANLKQEEASLDALVRQLETANARSEEREQALTHLQAVLDETRETLSEQDATLRVSEASKDNLRSEIQSSRAALNTLLAQLDQKTTERISIEVELETVRQGNAELKAKNAEQEEMIGILNEKLSESRAAITLNSEQTAQMHARCGELASAINQKEASLKAMQESLSKTESMAGKFRQQLGSSEEKARELERQLNDANDRISTTNSDLSMEFSAKERVRKELGDAQRLISEMKAQIDDLRDKIKNAGEKAMELETRLKQTTESRDALVGALRDEQVRSIEMESDLTETLGKVHEANDTIEELRQSKEVDNAAIANLQDLFRELRDRQLETLNELEKKINSVNPSTSSSSWLRSSRPTSESPLP